MKIEGSRGFEKTTKIEPDEPTEKKNKANKRWKLVKGAVAVGVVGTGKVALGPGGIIFGMLAAMLFYKKKLGKFNGLLMKLLKNRTLWRALLFLYDIGMFNLDNLKRMISVFQVKKNIWALTSKFAKLMMRSGSTRMRNTKEQKSKWYSVLMEVLLAEFVEASGEDDRAFLLYVDEEEDFMVCQENRNLVVEISENSDFEDGAEFVEADQIPRTAETEDTGDPGT